MTNTEAWDYAIGMIKVDGLQPTKEFKEYIEKEKRGEITMEEFCCQFILLMEVILGKKSICTKLYMMLMKESQKWAKEVGMTEDDIDEAITAVRKRRKF